MSDCIICTMCSNDVERVLNSTTFALSALYLYVSACFSKLCIDETRRLTGLVTVRESRKYTVTEMIRLNSSATAIPTAICLLTD